MIDCRR